MRLFHSICSPILASLLLLAACTGSGPDKSEFDVQLVLMLPYYDVNDVKIEGTASIGDNATPAFKSRFSASITPKQPLYVEAGIEHDVRLIRETVPMGSKTKIFGVAISKKRGDGWSTDITFEELPTGKQRNEFTGANYVRGSAEGDAVISAAISAKQAAVAAQIAEQKRRLEIAQEAEAAAFKEFSEAKSAQQKSDAFKSLSHGKKVEVMRNLAVGKFAGTAECMNDDRQPVIIEIEIMDFDKDLSLRGTVRYSEIRRAWRNEPNRAFQIIGSITNTNIQFSPEGFTQFIVSPLFKDENKGSFLSDGLFVRLHWLARNISINPGVMGPCGTELKG
jgi:hypothetical protein